MSMDVFTSQKEILIFIGRNVSCDAKSNGKNRFMSGISKSNHFPDVGVRNELWESWLVILMWKK